MLPSELTDDFLKPLTAAWIGKIELGLQQREPFDTVADQCMTFFCGAVGDFWRDDFQKRFLGTILSPKFQISVNKAFELVALYGPVLYNRNPVRTVYPASDPIPLDPALFGDPNDPYAQQSYQMAIMQQNAEYAKAKTACALMERYLNYTPTEQPGGGLQQAGEDGVTEALLTGRGLLWPAPFRMPGSQRTMTGCFYDSVRNLVTDPDARRIEFGETRWIARKHLEPVWEVERRFRLPPGTLKGKGIAETAEAQAERSSHALGNMERSKGHSFDLMEWWEIWSIGGAGGRLSGVNHFLKQTLDKYVGDYAYMCVSKSVPWFLNCPTEVMRTAYPEEIQQRFRWPVPYWMDRRWPVAILDFYRHPRRAWPISPMAPGLGELTFLNFLLSRTANHIWESTKTFVAVVQSAKEEVEKILRRGEDLAVFGIPDMQRTIKDLVSFLELPDVSKDIWIIADAVMELFDKRVGLTDIWYSMNAGGVASRTATDVQAKQEKASIRPDYMASRVETWLSEASSMEKMCAQWAGVSGRDVADLLGATGAALWDTLITEADPEVVARQMKSSVAVGSAKKRNKQLELANINQTYAPLSQQLAQYAATTGDTEPLNALNQKLFNALDADGEGLQMGPWAPPPPPPGADPAAMQAEAELAMQQQQHEVDIAQGAQKHEQEIFQDAERHAQEMEQAQQDMDIQRQEGLQKLRLEQMKADAQVRMARIKAKQQPAKTTGNK